MRHKVAGRGLGRNTNHRKALLRNLVTALFDHLKIETTVAKAKEARKLAEKVITLARKGDLAARRLALSHIPNKDMVRKLFIEVAPKIERTSGYLRVVKTRFRSGDNSDMAILEFVDYDVLKGAVAAPKAETEEKPKKKKAKEPKAPKAEKASKTAKPKRTAKAAEEKDKDKK
ncbi:MAG: 50S ribosomal protein L17 [Nitrospiraceae bacterium]|nr:MAG: 50S ribosomal protein L17 [Nitrospiraceae bacterium]